MQQIKQELQQTIAKLKSEWGINNFSLQDLAAILEKVVAAVDRAAQLPVVPESVGGVKIVEGYTLKYRAAPPILDYNAPSTAKPALGIDGNNCVVKVFFDKDTQRSYSRNSEGVSAMDFFGDKILSDGNSLNYVSFHEETEVIVRAYGRFSGEDPSFFI